MSRNYMFNDKDNEDRKKQRINRQDELRQLRRDEMLSRRRDVKQTAPGDISATYSEIRSKIMSTNIDEVQSAANKLRNILSADDNPPIQDVIDSGVVPRLVELLSPACDCYLEAAENVIITTRLESAWALTNIASGTTEQTAHVIESGAIPLLVDMLNDDNPEVIDQGIWALGNIAGDNEISRDVIIDSDVLSRLLNLMMRIIDDPRYSKLLRNATWLLANLNRGRNPPPALPNMEMSLHMMLRLVELKDPDTLNDVFWGLSYICDAESQAADMVLRTGVLAKAMEFLKDAVQGGTTGTYLTCSIIRMLGNIVTGNDEQADVVVKSGFLAVFRELYTRYNDRQRLMKIRKEICWTLSNIAAGTDDQARAIFTEGLVPVLIDGLDCDINVRIEAAWAICNIIAAFDKDEEHVDTLLNTNLLPSIVGSLPQLRGHADLEKQVLSVCKRILDAGNRIYETRGDRNLVFEVLKNTRLPSIVKELVNCSDSKVRDKAQVLLQLYFL